jgi:hypothetical protein
MGEWGASAPLQAPAVAARGLRHVRVSAGSKASRRRGRTLPHLSAPAPHRPHLTPSPYMTYYFDSKAPDAPPSGPEDDEGGDKPPARGAAAVAAA